MMWNVFARLRLVAFGLGVLAAGSVVEASVISLKAVKKNNVAIPGGPTNSLSVLPNDTIEAEMFLSGWINDWPNDGVPNNVRTFQVKVDRAGYVSADNGSALPLGWCAPLDVIGCTQSATCPPEYPICLTSPPTGCTCSPHTPAVGAFMTTSRTDFLLNGLDVLFAVLTSNIDFQYYGLATDSSVPDTGVPRYLGTVTFKVSANACGTFTLDFVHDIESTFIADPNNVTAERPTTQPLLLTVAVSDCIRQLVSCNPLSSAGLPEGSHCAEDARIPHDRLNASQRLNWNTIQMTFSKPTAGMVPADFEVTLVPVVPGDLIPVVSTVTPNGNNATVILSRRIQVMRWTCIRDKGSNKRCCMGSLPADADGLPRNSDGKLVSELDDMFEVYDNLQGFVSPALVMEKCDTDRSLRCSPADLLMVVDLLNGADAFIEVNGDTLPMPCPPMRLPP